MKKALFGITMAALAASAMAQPYAGWAKSRDITINTATANVFGDVTNFPLLVRLTNASAATGSDVLADDATGASLRFSSANGLTPLPYQIEQWGASSAVVWVKVPSIAGSATTTIRMYWGNGSAPSESDGAAVFAVADGFEGVYHMNDANDANATDATSNAYHMSPGGNNGNPVNVAGAIGDGKDFLGSGAGTNTSGSYYTIAGTNAAAPKLNFDPAASLYTVSAWVRADFLPASTASAGRMGIVMKYGSTTNQAYMLALVGNSAGARWSGNHKQTNGEAWNESNATAEVWTHIATVRSGPAVGTAQGGNGTLYVDGQPAGFAPTGNGTSMGNGLGGDLFIGAYSNPTRYFDGQIDEVNLSSVARSQDWITLSYATQVAGQTTVTLGTTTGVLSAPAGHAGTAFAASAFGRGLSFEIKGASLAAKVSVSVMDMRGRPVWVRTVSLNGGSAQLAWDGSTANGLAAPGIYAARAVLLDANGKSVRTLERKVPLTR